MFCIRRLEGNCRIIRLVREVQEGLKILWRRLLLKRMVRGSRQDRNSWAPGLALIEISAAEYLYRAYYSE
ncbi:MAG: hypothetical protein ACK2T3_10875 [Candidatus Promineifilaceae bacterium]